MTNCNYDMSSVVKFSLCVADTKCEYVCVNMLINYKEIEMCLSCI